MFWITSKAIPTLPIARSDNYDFLVGILMEMGEDFRIVEVLEGTEGVKFITNIGREPL